MCWGGDGHRLETMSPSRFEMCYYIVCSVVMLKCLSVHTTGGGAMGERKKRKFSNPISSERGCYSETALVNLATL